VIYYPTVTVMAQYSLFVLKVPLNPKQTNNFPSVYTEKWKNHTRFSLVPQVAVKYVMKKILRGDANTARWL